MTSISLSNGVEMPPIVMGTSVDDRMGKRKKLIAQMCSNVGFAVEHGVRAFDTSKSYGNESLLGDVFKKLIKSGRISREELFITTKVGNRQQLSRNMREQIDNSLKALRVDYIDLWLLHWPYPEYYIDNWYQFCEILKEGKVKAIGLANCRERHIIELERSGAPFLPHVIQIEYHPFRCVPSMREFCKRKNIQIEAYSANCVMLPFVKENKVLNEIALRHSKSLTQIMLRWHLQQGTIPIFSSMNKDHICSNLAIFDFELSAKEMESIFDLDCDYKFHPESVNCPGY